jgi:hypothetical protein
MISVQTQIEIQGDLSLTKISQELQALNFPKEILKTAIIKLQDELVLELCGPKYQRNPQKTIHPSRKHQSKPQYKTRQNNLQTSQTIQPASRKIISIKPI